MRKKMRKRFTSLMLCALLLLSFCPTAVFAVGTDEALLEKVATIDSAALYDGGSTGTLIEDKHLIKNPNDLYLIYTFSVNEDQLELIKSETPYQVPIPKGLKLLGSGNADLKMEIEETLAATAHEKTSQLHFATLAWSPSGATLTFTQDVVDAAKSDTITGIDGGHLYIGCAFDKPNAEPAENQENYYKITFQDKDQTSITVGLKEDFIEHAANLQKKWCRKGHSTSGRSPIRLTATPRKPALRSATSWELR